MVLIDVFSDVFKEDIISFRPLAGIMVLIRHWILFLCLKHFKVSVPLRGLWFLSDGSRTVYTAEPLFPSPCGDYGSYQMLLGMLMYDAVAVSVPLRGLWFLSGEAKKKIKKTRPSFRPLAGIMVLITRNMEKVFKFYNVFPSPCGDYGSYHS